MPKNLLLSLETIQAQLGYTFVNKELLFQAFTHSSFLNESTFPVQSNERLEFLGDAVLNLFVSEFLFREFPDKEEGELSKLKAHLVCQESCYKMEDLLGLTEHLLVGRGEKAALSPLSPTLAADLFEAIIGAIFLDGGWSAAAAFLHEKFSTFLLERTTSISINPKAELQEWLAKKGKSLPEYHVLETKGPSHQKEFTVVVSVGETRYATGTGKAKKEAQQKAAELTLEMLKKEEIS